MSGSPGATGELMDPKLQKILVPPSYDPDLEDREYSRSLLSPEELEQVKQADFLTIEDVREIVVQNSSKETMDARGETFAIDPEVLMTIDARINFNVFISGDNVFTRAELLRHYPFEEFGVAPEEVFVQQEVGVFPPKKHAIGAEQYEFIARDADDEEEFIMLEDLVGRAARRNYKMKRKATQVVKTKIYIGKGSWEDFTLMRRFTTCFERFTGLRLMGNGSLASLIADSPSRLAIRDTTGVEEERIHAHELAQRELERRAKALAQREAKLKVQEDELMRSLGVGEFDDLSDDSESPQATNTKNSTDPLQDMSALDSLLDDLESGSEADDSADDSSEFSDEADDAVKI